VRVGVHLERRAVQRKQPHLDAKQVFLLHEGENAREDAVLGPTLGALVDAVPLPVGSGQRPPFAAVLHDKKHGAKEDEVVDLHIAALDGKQRLNEVKLFLSKFHET